MWVSDADGPQKDVTVMRFMRVIFGVSSSPFLLNATHMRKFECSEKQFVDKFLCSVYVDNVTAGAPDVQSAYEFYVKLKLHLAKASFKVLYQARSDNRRF